MQQPITLIPYAISWDTPADDGGSKVDKYQVRLAIHDGGYSDWVDLSADPRFVALLPNNVEIAIQIRIVNDAGPGEVTTLKIRPVREPNPDLKKLIDDNFVNVRLEGPPKK